MNNLTEDVPVALLTIAGIQQITGIFNPLLMSIFYIASITWLVVQIKQKLKDKPKDNE